MNPKWLLVATFIIGAALSWGVYVPLVHLATKNIGSNLRAFLMVGVAYFLVAVVVPSVFIFLLKNDPTAKPNVNWATGSLLWGLLAGIAGAVGALFVIFATRDAVALVGPITGPLVVAPLVFAGAPIINTIAQMTIFAHGQKVPSPAPQFYAGLCLAAAGMAMVMVYKPTAPTPAAGKGPAAAPAAASPDTAKP